MNHHSTVLLRLFGRALELGLFLLFLHRKDCCGVFWLLQVTLDATYSLQLCWTVVDFQEHRALINFAEARGSPALRVFLLNQEALLLSLLLLRLINNLPFEFFLLRRETSGVAKGRKVHLVRISCVKQGAIM